MNCLSLTYLVILLQLVNYSVQQCTKTYTVKSGDYCWAIANSYGLTVDQLAALNPGLNCNNLQIGQVVCVSYTYATTAAAVTLGAVPYGCTNPYYVKPGDTCWAITNAYGMDQATLNAYNPGLNCNNLQVGQCICLGYAAATTAAPFVTTAAPIVTTAAPIVTTAAPIVTTIAPTYAPTTLAPTVSPVLCQRAYMIQSGDTCDLIARYNGLTLDQFYALNPGINCNSLQVGQAVCLSAFSQTAAPVVTTAPTVAPVVTTLAPVVTTLAPVVTSLAPVVTTLAACYCANPYYVKSGDYCYKIMSDYAVDQTTFYTLNPGINCNNLQVGQCVCLPTRTAPCTNQYAVKGGDYCWAIANNYGLTVDQLVALNPGLNCNNLQVGQVLKIRGTCY